MEKTSFYLAMSDSVKIAVDLALPKNLKPGEKLPTLLNQTRYVRSVEYSWPFSINEDRSEVSSKEQAFFARHGYAYITTDVRGSGASFGVRPYPWAPKETSDGAEIVDWIVKQPWSDGIVGSYGTSYTGTTAEFLLVNKHPAVKAAGIRFSLFDAYDDIAFPGGVHLDWFTEAWGRYNGILDRNAWGEFGFMASLAVKGVNLVYLEDVTPEGKVVYVTEGGLRALHRKISDEEGPYKDVIPYHSYLKKDGRPLEKGEVAELTFDLLPTSYLFKKGHSIRIAIAGADKDLFALMKTDPPPTLKFHRNETFASSIDLPVIPR
ncbi:MAG: CocE/NonD family hydrolase [Proteobacteria bacterium]|nr:CocE/NonD family hydrolase [Pseudomonadota bacterium]